MLHGYNDFDEIYDYAKAHEEWLDNLLHLWNGIPCARTINNAFRLISPEAFLTAFMTWVSKTVERVVGSQIIIDGKAIRATAEKAKNGNTPYIVSAYLADLGISIGQKRVDDKSNEITAIPNLLDVLELDDCIVTIDAMGTQKDIAAKIAEKNDYVLALKANQNNIYRDVYNYFEETIQDEKLYFDQNCLKTAEKSHGRIEKRAYYLSSDIDWLEGKNEWQNLKAIGAVWSETIRNGKLCTEHRYYLTTLSDLKIFADAVRSHWGVENSLHWCLDVVFNEDRCRSRKGNTAENFAVIRKVVLNILKNFPTEKPCSLNAKRLRCQFNFDFLADVLLSVFA